jgi:hypothetical protein
MPYATPPTRTLHRAQSQRFDANSGGNNAAGGAACCDRRPSATIAHYSELGSAHLAVQAGAGVWLKHPSTNSLHPVSGYIATVPPAAVVDYAPSVTFEDCRPTLRSATASTASPIGLYL